MISNLSAKMFWFVFILIFHVGSGELIPPTIQSILVPENIKAGNTIGIMCRVESGSIPLQFKWKFNEKQIDQKDVKLETVSEQYSTFFILCRNVFGAVGRFVRIFFDNFLINLTNM